MADGSGAAAGTVTNAPKFNKKSFEYKMCKKVAELTQVVHMLFVKNHEREVELEALRTAYEEEISNVITDARSQLEKLRHALAEEQRRSEGVKKDFEQNLGEKEKETSRKLLESELRVKELERDNGFMKEQVARLQSLADDSKSNEAEDRSQVEDDLTHFQEQLNRAHAELQEKKAELERFREIVGKQTDQQRGNDAIISKLRTEMEQMQSELSLQMEDLKSELLETTSGKERLQQKNKNLELDLRNLKKELKTRRQSDVVQPPVRSPKSPGSMDTIEELERLRREVRMYRMELSNREGNFNRMFTDSSPIRVDQRAGGMAMTRTRTEMNMQPGRPQLVVNNRTPRDLHGNPQPQYRPGFDRLPTLSMDGRQRAANSRSGRNRIAATPRERQVAGYPMSGYH